MRANVWPHNELRENARVAGQNFTLDSRKPPRFWAMASAKTAGKTAARTAGMAMVAATVFLSACAPKPAPEPEVVITDPGPPVRPVPPLGAATGMYIPPADEVSGQRLTPNSNISVNETIWHFRSAFNVAALNCIPPTYPSVVDYYSAFIGRMRVPLSRVNSELDEEFRARYPGATGNAALRIRDTHSTDIYNYFSLPPVMFQFCDLMLAKGPQAAALNEDQLYAFSRQTLDEVDAIFIKFYEDYEDYQRRLAEWEALYGNRGMVIFGGGALTRGYAAPAHAYAGAIGRSEVTLPVCGRGGGFV